VTDGAKKDPDQGAAEPLKEAAAVPPSLSSLALPADRAELERIAREQFDQIREARKVLAAEQEEAEQALQRRRQELEAQAQTMLARMSELQEREQRLGEGGPAANAAELEALQQKLHDYEFRLELLQAEKDAAWAQVQQTQEECEHRLDALRTELETLRHESQERIDNLSRVLREVGEERDQALAKLRQWPTREVAIQPGAPVPDRKIDSISGVGLQHTNIEVEAAGGKAGSISAFGLQHTDIELPELARELQAGNARPQLDALELEQLRAERAELRERIAQLEQEAQRREGEPAAPVRPKSGEFIDLAKATSIGQFGLEHTDLKLPESAHDLQSAGEVEQLRAERDALRDRVAQLQQDWERQQTQFVEIRKQLQLEAEALTRDAQELDRGKRALEGSAAQSKGQLSEDREFIARMQGELRKQMEDQRAREEDLRRREIEMRLQLAEIRELREISENECARDRAQLAQERIRIARLREALRRESEKFTPPPKSNPDL
jgi:hypothetical protein